MERAVAEFLRAAGMDGAGSDFLGTPKRVAEVWAQEFLDGYRQSAQQALGETYPAPPGSSGELVVVTDLSFHSTCPHHLLPYQGKAHLAYVPAKRVVGFGGLSALLNCFAHRLTLQEDLARNVAGAMAKVLKSPAAACIIEAEQACLRMRGHQQREARTHAEAYEGRLRRDSRLRQEIWYRIGGTHGRPPQL